jgi:phage FluMu protein Com
MRKYECHDCHHTWTIIFGDAAPGIKQACPNCKGLNVQRIDQSPNNAATSKQNPSLSSENTIKNQD